MAVAVSEVYVAPVRTFRLREERQEGKSWRLPPNHIQDLRDVTRGVEETNAGVCCRYLVDQLASQGGQDIDDDGYIHNLDAVERFCERFGVWAHPEVESWRQRIQRARRAIHRMHLRGEHKHISVLHVVYGFPDPFTRTFDKRVLDSLGELASLAKYTDVVEVKRQEMARQEAVERSKIVARFNTTKDVPNHWKELDDEITEFDPRRQSGDEFSRMAIHQGMTADLGEPLAEVMKHREMYKYAIRAISSADALRKHIEIDCEHEEGETKERYDERKEAVMLKRDQFVFQVKRAADEMLTDASKKYHQSWLQSA